MRPWGQPLAPRTADDLVLRGALAVPPQPRGHVILLEGRTEFLEKYAGVVQGLLDRNLAVAAVDWRGQGGSPRPTPDPMLGHVDDFAEFRLDLDALLALPEVASLPGPRLALGHSMGGAIALDWLTSLRDSDVPVRAAILSAPMLGLTLSALNRLIGPPLARAAVALGFGRRYAPGGGARPYAAAGFAGNLLTSDAEAFEAIAAFTADRPDLALGGPSWRWLDAAFRVMAALQERALTLPTLALLGTDEAVVSPAAIRAFADQPAVRLVEIDGARHEPFMETPATRETVWAAIDGFLAENGLGAAT